MAQNQTATVNKIDIAKATSTKAPAADLTQEEIAVFMALAKKLNVDVAALAQAVPVVIKSPEVNATSTLRQIAPNFWLEMQGNTGVIAYDSTFDGGLSASEKSHKVVSYSGELPGGLNCTIQIYRKRALSK